jgi:hypothetical protein
VVHRFASCPGCTASHRAKTKVGPAPADDAGLAQPRPGSLPLARPVGGPYFGGGNLP